MSTDRPATPENLPSSGLSRRSVVRGGATLAWSVPVIGVVTAAPAYAQSGILMITAQSATRPTIGDVVSASVTARNSDTSATKALRFVITIAPTNANYNFNQCTSSTPAGYLVSGPVPLSAGSRTAVFTYTAANQLAGNGQTATCAPQITLPAINGLNSRAGTLTFQAFAGGVGTDSMITMASYT